MPKFVDIEDIKTLRKKGLSHKEIAQTLGISATTVCNHLNKGKEKRTYTKVVNRKKSKDARKIKNERSPSVDKIDREPAKRSEQIRPGEACDDLTKVDFSDLRKFKESGRGY